MKNILVIEDHLSYRKMLVKILKKEGHQLFVAKNGEEGLELFKQTPQIDLVITDIMMPHKDGVSLIKSLRNNESWDGKICVITADNSQRTFEKIKNYGVDHVLFKGIDKNLLLNHINEILNDKHKTATIDEGFISIYQILEIVKNFQFVEQFGNEIKLICYQELPLGSLIKLNSNSLQGLHEIEKSYYQILDCFADGDKYHVKAKKV